MALGAKQATPEREGTRGRVVNIAGIDVNPRRCEQFTRLTGAPAYPMDLFTRDDYRNFHGQDPPPGWREVTPEDFRRIFGDTPPDIMTITAPCKGFSALLPQGAAATAKYRALNNLVYRAYWLCIMAWPNDPVPVFIFENVPRIKERGKDLLRMVKGILEGHKYAVSMEDHNLGVIGGLPQNRWRFKIAARQPDKCAPLIFRPPPRRVRTIAEALQEIPWMPNDPAAGPLHRLSRLDFINWLRLAFIRPGGDWKDIPAPGQWQLRTLDGRIVPPEAMDRRKPPDPNVWGRIFVAELLPGAPHYDDIRLSFRANRHRNKYRVCDAHSPADTVTGSDRLGSGAPALEDIRLGFMPRDGSFMVTDPDRPAPTITGNTSVTGSNGPGAIADIRLGRNPRRGVLRVNDPNEPAKTVTSHSDVNGDAHGLSDIRLGCRPRNGTLGVIAWEGPSPTVIASLDVHAGAAAVEDRRVNIHWWPEWFPECIIVSPWNAWHRPATELEMAVFQGFPAVWEDGQPFWLEGTRQDIREAIGNAMPPPAARAIIESVAISIMAARRGYDFILSPYGTPYWVRPPDQEQMIAD